MSDELEAEVLANQAMLDGKDPRFAELERLARELHQSGVDFRIEHGKIIQAAQDRDKDRETVIDFGRNHLKLAVWSDLHYGSKFEQQTATHAFRRYADEQGVDAFINGGDLTQGPDQMHRGMEHEVHAHGADAQVDYAVDAHPIPSIAVPEYIISGNHDDSHLKAGGVNVVRRFCQRRPDTVYLGQDAAYLTIGPMRSYVIHPDGGGSYAKSYKPQKIAESIPSEKGVNVVFMGHYHQYGVFRVGPTIVFMLPCFQSQYAWLARKGLHPDIGGLIVDLWFDDNQRIARVAHELVSFEPREDDWNYKISAEVNRGWSSRGLEVA